MTGYGAAEKVLGDTGMSLSCEVKSVNHRFFELSARLPKSLSSFEPEIRNIVRSKLSRGYITVKLNLEAGEEPPLPLRLDEKTADAYYSLLTQLKLRYNLPGEVDLATISAKEGVIKEQKEEMEELWEEIRDVLSRALESTYKMRVEEGERICQELEGSLQHMESHMTEIESRAPSRVAERRERLRERMRLLLEGGEVDASRLEQEILLFAERCDISEELSRLKSHIEGFRSSLRAEEPVGRRLNFLLQEMYREVNTLGAKASDAQISRLAVGLKEEVEKLREQVSNIE